MMLIKEQKKGRKTRNIHWELQIKKTWWNKTHIKPSKKAKVKHCISIQLTEDQHILLPTCHIWSCGLSYTLALLTDVLRLPRGTMGISMSNSKVSITPILFWCTHNDDVWSDLVFGVKEKICDVWLGLGTRSACWGQEETVGCELQSARSRSFVCDPDLHKKLDLLLIF